MIASFVLLMVLFIPYKYRTVKIIDIINPRSVLVCLYVFTCLLTSLINETPKPIIYGILAALYFVFIFSLDKKTIKKYISILTFVILVALFGSLFNLLMYKVGIPPLGIFNNYLSLYPFGGIFVDSGMNPRVSGFFLEPGQFSYYICFLVICRELLKMSSSLSLFLLVFGLITTSLAHVVFILVYLFYLVVKKNNSLASSLLRVRTYGRLLPIIFFVLPSLSIGLIMFGDWMIDRTLAMIDNPTDYMRFNSLTFAYNRLDNDLMNFIRGPAPNLAAREYFPAELLNGQEGMSIYGENPLSPLMFGGLLAAWPYYGFVLFALKELIFGKPKSILIFGFALLALQRPYLLEFPYAFSGLILLFLYNSEYKKYTPNENKI